jgi:hypothetical protein
VYTEERAHDLKLCDGDQKVEGEEGAKDMGDDAKVGRINALPVTAIIDSEIWRGAFLWVYYHQVYYQLLLGTSSEARLRRNRVSQDRKRQIGLVYRHHVFLLLRRCASNFCLQQPYTNPTVFIGYFIELHSNAWAHLTT